MAALKHDRNGAYWDRYASDLVFRGSVGAQCYWLACVAHATDKHCPFHELDAEEFMGTIGVDWTLSRGGRWGAWLMHNPVREYRNDPLYTDAMCRWALIEICFEQCVDARRMQTTKENMQEI
ncbi:MAG: hypothetical protein GY826_36990 [Fuerstiella sp.]|nr:hypothetical protein [Fuerstiella sp.]